MKTLSEELREKADQYDEAPYNTTDTVLMRSCANLIENLYKAKQELKELREENKRLKKQLQK